MSWQSYPITHMDGIATSRSSAQYSVGAAAYPRGHILHDFLEARVLPRIVGPLGPGKLQYAALWKTAQRMTTKPIKFGTPLPEFWPRPSKIILQGSGRAHLGVQRSDQPRAA